METKNPLESKGLQGALLVFVTYYVFNFTDLEITQVELANLIEAAFVLGGAIYSFYGRWVASNPISLFSNKDVIKVDVSGMSEAEKNALTGILNGERKQ